jgi:hypothetical protein
MLAIALAACSTGALNVPGAPAPPPEDPAPLALQLDEPAAGAFVGDRVAVKGQVSDPEAIVWIEGYRANVGSDGAFSVEVPVDGDFRVVDVEAARPWTEEHLRERRAVFGGVDPLASWPGGLGVRATPVLLDHLAEILQAELEALDLPGQLEALAPELAFGDLVLAPTGVIAPPPTVGIMSDVEGLVAEVALGRIEVGYEVTASWLPTPIEVVLGLDGAELAGRAALGIDAADNLTLAVTDTAVSIGAPVFEVAGIDPEVLEQLAANLTAGLAGILEGVLDGALAGIGEIAIPLGEISFDALGVPLTFAVEELGTDDAGIAALLAIDLGVPPVGAPRVPDLFAAGPQADVALAVHEGLVQGLLDTGILDLLDLDLDLPGFLGEAVALPLTALPGGEQLPSERAGMCFTIAPGEQRVARLKPSLAPLAVVTLPDVLADVGVLTTSGSCQPWLSASLSIQASFHAEGSVLTTELAVVDGAVLSYAAEGEFPEDEIVEGLGALVGVASSLLGGAGLEIDLADILGGLDGGALPLGELSPRLLDVTPALGADGAALPGAMVVAVSLWD